MTFFNYYITSDKIRFITIKVYNKLLLQKPNFKNQKTPNNHSLFTTLPITILIQATLNHLSTERKLSQPPIARESADPREIVKLYRSGGAVFTIAQCALVEPPLSPDYRIEKLISRSSIISLLLPRQS